VRFLALFSACLLALGGLLFLGSRGKIVPESLPERPGRSGEASVLVSQDLADEHGYSPLPGRLLWMKGLSVRAVKEDYVFCEAGFLELVREEGRPRARGIWCRVYDRPEEGAARLRAEIRSPYLDGDPARFVHARRGDPLPASFRGGVEARDARGRLLLRVPDRLLLDFSGQRVWTGEHVLLSHPDQGVEISGAGLAAGVRLEEARIFRDVEATFRLAGGEGRAVLRCDGPLTARNLGEALLVEAEGAVSLDHPEGRLECDRLEVYVVGAREGEGSGRFRPASAFASGSVTLSGPGGRIVARAARLSWDGRLAALEGPVAARFEGPFAAFGPGEREVDLVADGATFDLEEGEAILRGNVSARDAGGGGDLAAERVRLREGLLEADGAVRARTKLGTLVASSVRLEEGGEGVVAARLEAVERLELAVAGRPGREEEGLLRLACRGVLEAEGSGARRTLRAGGGVEAVLLDARGREDARLSAEGLRAVLAGDELREVQADESVVLTDVARRTVVSGTALRYDRAEGVARVEGSPATLTLPADGGGRRVVRARRLVHREREGAFEAEEEVSVTTPLRAAVWTVRCDRASGVAAEGGRVERLAAEGEVDAEGPDGQRLQGTRLTYDAAEGVATLLGEPARLLLGASGWIEAPAFEATVDGKTGEWKEARTRGKGELAYLPEARGGEDAPASVHVWRVTLDGPVEVRDLLVRVPAGAALRALDAEGKTVLEGRAGSVLVRLERREGKLAPRRLEGSEGVTLRAATSKRGAVLVEAARLAFEPDTSRVVLEGSARASAQGIAPEARFARIELVLAKDGVEDLECFNLEITRKTDDVQPEPR